jgi:hypothetical protein
MKHLTDWQSCRTNLYSVLIVVLRKRIEQTIYLMNITNLSLRSLERRSWYSVSPTGRSNLFPLIMSQAVKLSSLRNSLRFYDCSHMVDMLVTPNLRAFLAVCFHRAYHPCTTFRRRRTIIQRKQENGAVSITSHST